MSCVMRLTQNQNESILNMGAWSFVGKYCFMVCDAESEFNDY